MSVPVWLDEPYQPRAVLDGDVSCEVCVVGAGAGGLATAWHLARHGVTQIVVVDRGIVAGGASGRNGGFFIAGAAPTHDGARARWGADRARAIYAATLATQQQMLEIAEEVGAREHFRIAGMLRVDRDLAVRAHHAALVTDGFDGELVRELPAALGRPGQLGLLTRHDGAVHPVRWLRALAQALEARGVHIHEGTEVMSPTAAGELRTPRGVIRAGAAVVAADAGLAALVPSAGHVRSRRLQMLATAPTAELLSRPVYVRGGHEYAQQLADGRVALGGFSDLDGQASWTDRAEISHAVQARLDAYLRDDLGVLAPVTHRWAGLVGYARDPLPTVGAAGEDLFVLGGYNGTGHVQGFLAGRIVAELVVGGSSPDGDLYRTPDRGG